MLNFRFKKLDDEMHFWAGMIIMFFIFFISNFFFSQWVSALIGFAASGISGISKEIYDQRVKGTKFDWRDAKWTIIGGFVLTALFIIADIIYYYSKP